MRKKGGLRVAPNILPPAAPGDLMRANKCTAAGMR